ncbi:MAG: sulfatase [Anaerolineae bacterium]|nr:sulfatase [Anaerolineae bacterium]
MKNIILLITDTFRYDNLYSRAVRPVRTPALDRFVEERATEIAGFYTGSFPTIPHRTDVASGLVGWPHYGWQPIDLSGPNHIGRLLHDQGYVSQLLCDCPHLFNARFQHGFDAAFQHRGQEGDKALLHLNDPIPSVVPLHKTRRRPLFQGHPLVDLHQWHNREPRYEGDTFPFKTGNTAIRWLEENSQARPFFLWVDFFDPHEPWDAPEYLVRRYDPDYDGLPMSHPNYGPSTDYEAAELQNLWAHYAAEAEVVDRWVGRVLEKTDDLQLWEDTIVAITSDHGMSIGEHGRTGKSNIHEGDGRYWPIYPEIGHVPFLIAGGEVPRGQRLDLIAQPVDILPTLCELAGVTVEPDKPLEGLSFAQAVVDGHGTHREYAVSGCHIQVVDNAPPRKATTPFLVTAEWGYTPMGASGWCELYDLRADPLATTDLAAEHPAEIVALYDLLLAHLQEHGAPEEMCAAWQHSEEESGGVWATDYPKADV